MLRVHYRPPELLPSHQRDFPPRDAAPDILFERDVPPRDAAPSILQVRDTRFLMLLVTGYVLAMLGGVVILHALSPVSHATKHPSKATNVKVTPR